VFAIATAFEHFEHNTLNNLERLLQHGEVQGDPLLQLGKAGFLEDDKLPYDIPFSVAMDKLVKTDIEVNESNIDAFIISQVPDFHQNNWDNERKQSIYQQAKLILSNKRYDALTFEMFQLQGTPSSILIDKQGILRQVSFVAIDQLDTNVQALLKE